jgi:hypothetical protein
MHNIINLNPFKSPFGGFRGLSFLLLLPLLFSCSVRPPLTTETARLSLVSIAAHAEAGVDSMQGSGSVVLAQNGERVSVSFDIRWAGDSSFLAEFSTPLGMTVASVKADRTGTWTVDAADSQYSVNPAENIGIGQGFLSYPVSWGEFLTLLTGRQMCAQIFSQEPDTQFVDKKGTTLVWKTRHCGRRTIDISGTIDNKTHALSELTYKGPSTDGWMVTISRFKDGRAKEFTFAQSNNNYFYVKYNSVKFYTTAGKRKAFRS